MNEFFFLILLLFSITLPFLHTSQSIILVLKVASSKEKKIGLSLILQQQAHASTPPPVPLCQIFSIWPRQGLPSYSSVLTLLPLRGGALPSFPVNLGGPVTRIEVMLSDFQAQVRKWNATSAQSP